MADPQPPKLLYRVRQSMGAKRHRIHTEGACAGRNGRYIPLHVKRHPWETMENEISAFLTHLAVEGTISASTQNQTLRALLFLHGLHGETLDQDLENSQNVVRAKKPSRLPVIFTQGEIQAVLAHMGGTCRLMRSLLYGSGLRLVECPGLRVKDPNFEYKQVILRDGEGEKDRPTILPEIIIEPLRNHLAKVKLIHEQDLKEGYGNAYLPYALARKYPNAGREWGWQYGFPAAYRSKDPRSTQIRRHHVGEEVLPRAVEKAVRKAGIVKSGTCQTFRHYAEYPTMPRSFHTGTSSTRQYYLTCIYQSASLGIFQMTFPADRQSGGATPNRMCSASCMLQSKRALFSDSLQSGMQGLLDDCYPGRVRESESAGNMPSLRT